MKNLKKNLIILFSLSISIAFAPKAFAQLPGNIGIPGKTASATTDIAGKVQKMKESLNLNSTQVSKITSIYTKAEQKIADLKKSGIDPTSILSQTKGINKNADKQVNALLTPDQQAKWKTLKAKL